MLTPPPPVDDDLAELQAVRTRLARELSIMDERVGRLARVKAAHEQAAPAPVDAERLRAVHEKLRRAAETLEGAHRVRAAVSDHLVARAHGGIAAPPAGAARRRRFVPVVLAVALAALVAGAAGATLLDADDPPSRTAASTPAPAPARDMPRCAELPADAGRAGAVSCTTGTALTIGAAGRPLELRELTAQVDDVARGDGGVDVRLRITNRTATTQSLDERVYLSLRGQRIYATADPIPARATRTLSLSFAVGDTAASSADLGIVPFGEPAGDEARRLGVVRLSLPPA